MGVGLMLVGAMMVVHVALFLAVRRWSVAWAADGPLVEPRAPEQSAHPLLWLGLLLGVGAALRLYDLGNGLWFDEIQTVTRYLRLPLGEILTTFDSQNQHMAYSVLARLCVLTFGESAWAVRLPAVGFGVASLWAVYWFGTMVASRREAILAVAFLTFSYHHVWFSQNARGYTGLLFFTLVSSGLFLRLVRLEGGRRWWDVVGYAVAGALGVYTHVTAAFVVIAHAVIWAGLAWRQRNRVTGFGRWAPGVAIVLAGTLSFQLYAIVLPQFFATLLQPTMAEFDTEWKSPVWLVGETVRGLAAGIPGGLVTVVGGMIVFGAGVVSYARERVETVLVMVLPALLLTGAVVALRHNLWPRLFLFSAGFGALFVMRGLFTGARMVLGARGEAVALVAGVILTVGSATTVPTAWNPKQDYRGALALLDEAAAEGEAVVTVDMTAIPFRDYYGRAWPVVESSDDLEAIERTHDQTWVAYAFPTRLSAVHPDIWSRLHDVYRPVAEFPGTVGGGTVIVMVKG